MRPMKLFVLAVLVGAVAVIGCNDETTGTAGSGGSGTAGSGGSGTAGSGGTAGNGGDGGMGGGGAGGSDQVVQVFVTSGTFDGGFGDQAGGDTACTAAATAEGLSGTWTAWLGNGSCGTCMTAKERIPDGVYRLLNGTVVADDKEDLTDGTLGVAIDLTEQETTLDAGYVWTGEQADGTSGGVGTCRVWTMSDDATRARVGDPTATDQTWSDLGEGDPDTGGMTCDTQLHLYCFSGG